VEPESFEEVGVVGLQQKCPGGGEPSRHGEIVISLEDSPKGGSTRSGVGSVP